MEIEEELAEAERELAKREDLLIQHFEKLIADRKLGDFMIWHTKRTMFHGFLIGFAVAMIVCIILALVL